MVGNHRGTAGSPGHHQVEHVQQKNTTNIPASKPLLLLRPMLCIHFSCKDDVVSYKENIIWNHKVEIPIHVEPWWSGILWYLSLRSDLSSWIRHGIKHQGLLVRYLILIQKSTVVVFVVVSFAVIADAQFVVFVLNSLILISNTSLLQQIPSSMSMAWNSQDQHTRVSLSMGEWMVMASTRFPMDPGMKGVWKMGSFMVRGVDYCCNWG